MRKKWLMAVISISLVIFCMSGPTFAAEEAELTVGVQVVNITTDKGLSSATINAKRGTTVIWVNKTFVPQEMLFTDKKVVLSCNAPVNFFVGKERAYESGKIPFGGIASLCFIEKGTYEYEMRSSKTFYETYSPIKRENKGSITIK